MRDVLIKQKHVMAFSPELEFTQFFLGVTRKVFSSPAESKIALFEHERLIIHGERAFTQDLSGFQFKPFRWA